MKGNISLQIRTERKARELSQDRLGDILNVSQDTISLWEKGKSKPALDDVERMADIFGCSIDYLVGREAEDGRISLGLSHVQSLALDRFCVLNTIGQAKAISYMEGLAQNEKYKM